MSKRLSLIAVLLLVVPFSNAMAQTCRSAVRNDPAHDVSKFYTMADSDPVNQAGNYNSDANRNLNDYGVIFEDARTDACAAAAAVALYRKVSATIANANPTTGQSRWPVYNAEVNLDVSAYGGWLEGVNVGLIHATALELGAKGKLTRALHDLLMSINYPANIDYHCGFDGDAPPSNPRNPEPGYQPSPRWSAGNSCMEDYALAAHAWAWIGAYRRWNPLVMSAWWEVTQARQNMTAALSPNSSICITPDYASNPGNPMQYWVGRNSRGPCTGTIAELASGKIPVAMHGGDAMPYGIGIMTSMSSAAVGMDHAGAPITLNGDEAAVAEALRTRGRDKTIFDGTAGDWRFKTDCIDFDWNPSYPDYMQVNHNFNCGENYGDGGYKPKMFPVSNYYARYVPNTNGTSQFDFGQWDANLFLNDFSFFGAGRRAVYKTLSQDWVNASGRPPLSAALNRVSFRAIDNAHYLHAVNGGGSSVDAASTSVGLHEQFGLIDVNGGTLNHGDLVQIQVHNGKWVVAENGGPGVVNANRDEPDGWETFVIRKTNGTGGAITSGTTVSLQSYWYGYYVAAENGGGGAVNCDRTAVGPWETFTLTLH